MTPPQWQPPQDQPGAPPAAQPPGRRDKPNVVVILGLVAIIVALVVIGIVATKWGGEGSTAAPNPTPERTEIDTAAATASPPTASASSDGEPKTPQGWRIKQIGELAGLGGNSLETAMIKFTVDRIDVNPKCNQFSPDVPAGQKVVVLHVSMTTGQLDEQGIVAAPMIFNPFSLKGLTPDGFVHSGTPSICLAAGTEFPTDIAPNSRYAGTVEVTLPNAVTMVASAESTTGWAWPLP